ncbi:MAG: hypothetical protein ACYSTY_13395 [Planctomycetota bacterium]|jgi:hypothetical protein
MPHETVKLELTVPADKADVLRECAELLSEGGPQAEAIEELVSGELVVFEIEQADSSEEA